MGIRQLAAAVAWMVIVIPNAGCAKSLETQDDGQVRIYRLDTEDYRIEMTIRFLPPYLGRRLTLFNTANPGQPLCSPENVDSRSCVESVVRFVGSLAAVRYRFHPRLPHISAAATCREVVKVLAQSEGLDARPAFTREQPLVRGMGSDIQAFGYDESDVAEPQRAAVRAERAKLWRVYRQELFVNRDKEPFAIVEWKLTLDRIEVIRVAGRPVADRP
jgi:hypothetical protein